MFDRNHRSAVLLAALALAACAGLATGQTPAKAPPPSDAGKPLAQPAKPADGADKPAPNPIRFGAPTPIAKPAGALRIVQYNVENLFDDKDDPNLSGRYEDLGQTKPDAYCQAAGATIKSLNADIVALEEVESKEALTWFRDKYLADAGFTYLESLDAGDERGIEQGVLSKYPISDVKNWVHMDLGGTHPDKWGRDKNENAGKPIQFHRSPLEVTVTVPADASKPNSKPYQVTLFVCHFKSGAPGDYWRQKEATKTTELIKQFETSHPDANVVLLGDFNAKPEDRPIQIITGAGMIDTFAPVRGTGKKVEPLYVTHETGRAIDYIFLNANAQKELIAETRFILGTPARPAGSDYRTTAPPPGYVSDHYPCVIDLTPVDK